MDQGTTHVALDDSKRKLVVAILRPGQTEPEQREMPNEPRLIQRLFRRLTCEGSVAACYEAGVSGYDLYRQITACGAACHVIAPALTQRRPGQRIKTDRRDAEEAVRDLTRCREDLRRDVLRWRHRLLKFLSDRSPVESHSAADESRHITDARERPHHVFSTADASGP